MTSSSLALVRSTRSELVKLKRTLALWVVLAVPLAVLGIIGANVVSRGPTTQLPRGNPWLALLDNFVLFVWCRLAFPLLVTLVAALLAGMEHADNHWPRLFALAIPRWSIYVGKLLAAAGLLILSSIVLGLGIGLLGLALNRTNPNLGLVGPVPWAEIFRQVGAVCLGSLLLLAVQTWLALRWRSFALAAGIGIAGTLVAVILALSSAGPTLGRVFPWAMPAGSVPTPPFVSPDPGMVLSISVVVGSIAIALGCWNVVRRDVA